MENGSAIGFKKGLSFVELKEVIEKHLGISFFATIKTGYEPGFGIIPNDDITLSIYSEKHDTLDSKQWNSYFRECIKNGDVKMVLVHRMLELNDEWREPDLGYRAVIFGFRKSDKGE